MVQRYKKNTSGWYLMPTNGLYHRSAQTAKGEVYTDLAGKPYIIPKFSDLLASSPIPVTAALFVPLYSEYVHAYFMRGENADIAAHILRRGRPDEQCLDDVISVFDNFDRTIGQGNPKIVIIDQGYNLIQEFFKRRHKSVEILRNPIPVRL